MKKLSLITLLALSTTSFQSKAQESSSVMITVITYGKEITLQVIDDQNKVSMTLQQPQWGAGITISKWSKDVKNYVINCFI